MRRAIRFLARLYPAPWRAKYGDEFDTLIDDATPTAHAAFDVLKGAVKMQMTSGNFASTLVTGAVAGALLAFAISFAFPRMYRSQASIAVLDTRQPQAISRIFSVEQEVLSRKSLGSIIQKKGLYPAERARIPFDDVINLMRRNIVVRPSPAPSLANPAPSEIVVEFRYPDADLARQAATALQGSFIDISFRRELSDENSPFHDHGQPLTPKTRATLPLNPIGPNRIWIATSGLVAGLLAAVTLSFVKRRGSATA